MIISFLILAVVVVVVLVGYRTSRAGYESAPCQVVRASGKFELRDYPALTVVETRMASAGDGDDGSFMRLFRYIGGSNNAGEKIAMTTPVFMSGSDSNRLMAFVLPVKFKPGGVPQPADGSVSVRVLPAGQFAVLRFSGGRSAQHEAAALERLKTWLAAQGLKASSPPVYAYFDPPWTPPFLRRNEVMLRTGSDAE